MTAVAALSSLAVLAGGVAQAEAAGNPSTQGVTATAKAKKCKLKRHLYHPVRTTVVVGNVSVRCSKASKVTKVKNILTLYRNGKVVDHLNVNGPKGKRYADAQTSAQMSGKHCQKWKLKVWTLAFNKKHKLVYEFAKTSRAKKICP
ncbi:hypothetical protein ACQB60_17265 [Actinomycetota bacterium Odt1-20B]